MDGWLAGGISACWLGGLRALCCYGPRCDDTQLVIDHDSPVRGSGAVTLSNTQLHGSVWPFSGHRGFRRPVPVGTRHLLLLLQQLGRVLLRSTVPLVGCCSSKTCVYGSNHSVVDTGRT